jgi:cell division protein FtsN
MRDYSSQATKHRQAPKKGGPSAALGVTLSIVLVGVVAAALIWLTQTTAPESESTDAVPMAQPEAKPATPEPSNAEEKPKTDVAVQEIPEAPEHFYTFYDLLIEGEVPIDIESGQTRDEAIAERLKNTLVQVASFRSAESAESTRVALLFLDLKARVLPPSESNGGWHRVVIGPFKTVRDMQAAIDRLTKNGHDAQPVME